MIGLQIQIFALTITLIGNFFMLNGINSTLNKINDTLEEKENE